MGAGRDHRVLNTRKIVAGILAIGLGFPALAAANHQQLPVAYTSIPSQELDERSAAVEYANDLLALDGAASKLGKRRSPRYRRFSGVFYTRAVAVGKEDLVVRLRSRGKRKSILTVELKF
jgi:hypothetical protein